MKNPAHPGALLKDDSEALGYSIAAAAKGLGVTRQQLYRVSNGASALTSAMALRLETALGGDADFWLGMQSAYDLATARREQGKSRVAPFVAHGAV